MRYLFLQRRLWVCGKVDEVLQRCKLWQMASLQLWQMQAPSEVEGFFSFVLFGMHMTLLNEAVLGLGHGKKDGKRSWSFGFEQAGPGQT
jgi:hypothetical protein